MSGTMLKLEKACRLNADMSAVASSLTSLLKCVALHTHKHTHTLLCDTIAWNDWRALQKCWPCVVSCLKRISHACAPTMRREAAAAAAARIVCVCSRVVYMRISCALPIQAERAVCECYSLALAIALVCAAAAACALESRVSYELCVC